jgi:hypothetical protein
MEGELTVDLKDLLETFFRHKEGYEKASLLTDDKELQKVLKSISHYKEISATEIKNILKNHSYQTDDDNIRKRNLSKILSSFNNNDNKFIIEACLIKESLLKNKLELLLGKNYNLRIKMMLENNIHQSIVIKSLLWEQSIRF